MFRTPSTLSGNLVRHSRSECTRYYPAVYSFASRLTDDPREAIALTRDAFNSTRKQLRSCCDDNVFASILTSAVIRAGLTARLKCAHIAGIRGFATAFSCQSRAADGVKSSVKLPPRRTQNLRFLKLGSIVSVEGCRHGRFTVCSVCATVPRTTCASFGCRFGRD